MVLIILQIALYMSKLLCYRLCSIKKFILNSIDYGGIIRYIDVITELFDTEIMDCRVINDLRVERIHSCMKGVHVYSSYINYGLVYVLVT